MMPWVKIKKRIGNVDVRIGEYDFSTNPSLEVRIIDETPKEKKKVKVFRPIKPS